MYSSPCSKLSFNYMLLLNEIKTMHVGREVINVIVKLIFIICSHDIHVSIYTNNSYNENTKWGIVIQDNLGKRM